ncbi:selenide, water dikinase SelD [Thermocoleostomius sinensis]|uniref:Selenide, water dikinase SelD n=1 Tax=Thermocoleostomius sinensis A174 TaxID=2016057 RepID=A0A9E8ZFQ0_9CYAN|nr:selenide, water dikinase SelD [Thermocoleostomius sinensis]WAL62293.1 selenide, water dikinase SelD [Thermocoleostomius sinensis A174]
MQSTSQPIVKDLVLIGGGHSHAIALKQFGMNPLPGVRLTLITDVYHTPYSGMLPGYVAGLYNFDDCHIDLRPLAEFAGATMIASQAVGLDLKSQRVLLIDRPSLSFDLLSIDIGSTPSTLTVPGAAKYAIPVKPISKFLQRWETLVAQVEQRPKRLLRIAIVGGGAGGVELALSVQARLQRLYEASHSPPSLLELHLFHRGQRLLPERGRWLGDRLEHLLQQRGVRLHLQETVCGLEGIAGSGDGGLETGEAVTVHCESGLVVTCDVVFWVTQAAAAPWLRDSGLDTDDRGFVQVSDTLQSLSHPQVLAAGDVATMVNYPRPKAGVFAVRHGKPLYQNLRRLLLNQAPQPFVPQKEFLILIGMGDRSALASRGRFGLGPYSWIWRWKERIDRRFMEKFSKLDMGNGRLGRRKAGDRSGKIATVRPMLTEAYPSIPAMHCAGCGSKVGSSVLERVLARIRQEQPDRSRDDILVGLDTPDDAAVVSVPADQVMVQTIDQFRALLSDPFVFGKIAANHCLSDLFAMGANPQSALAVATIPYGLESKQAETLYQLLSGAVQVLQQSNAVLIGGHTTEGAELSFGLSCNGLVTPDRLWRKGGMQPGDSLILTKAIGTGTLFAADMRLQAKGRWIEGAIDSMLQSNQAAADCLREYQATACTDVTGFGLLGHLAEMVRSSGMSVGLDLNALPILEGAKETAQQGILSSLHLQNQQASHLIKNLDAATRHPLYPLLFDPQTSGGLLATVAASCTSECLFALKALGYDQSRAIGVVLPSLETPCIEIR